MDHNTRHDEDNDNNGPAEWSFIDVDSSDDENEYGIMMIVDTCF